MKLNPKEIKKLETRMAEAREVLIEMPHDEKLDRLPDFIWMTAFMDYECAPQLKEEAMCFFETLAAYKYSYQMNNEKPPHTDMSTFGHGHYNDEYMPNFVFGFLSIIPPEKYNPWHFIFTELHKYKFCMDMDIPFEMAKGQDFNDRMQFVQSGQYLN